MNTPQLHIQNQTLPINVIAARLLGWEHIYFGPAKHHPPGTHSADIWRGMAPGQSVSENDFPLPIPDFEGDLNLCQRLEETLSDEQRFFYYETALPEVCGPSIHNHAVISARADERVRAVVSTINATKP